VAWPSKPEEVAQQRSHRGVIVHFQDLPPSGLQVLTAAYHASSPRMPMRMSCLRTGYQPRNGMLGADQPSSCRLSWKTISRLCTLPWAWRRQGGWDNTDVRRSTDSPRTKTPLPSHVELSACTRTFTPSFLRLDRKRFVKPERIKRQSLSGALQSHLFQWLIFVLHSTAQSLESYRINNIFSQQKYHLFILIAKILCKSLFY
jgi:hypothetical protein